MLMLAISVCPMLSCGDMTFLMGSVAMKFLGKWAVVSIQARIIQSEQLNVSNCQCVMIFAGTLLKLRLSNIRAGILP